MPEENNDRSDTDRRSAGDRPKSNKPNVASNWEERLSAARAKRALVLARGLVRTSSDKANAEPAIGNAPEAGGLAEHADVSLPEIDAPSPQATAAVIPAPAVQIVPTGQVALQSHEGVHRDSDPNLASKARFGRTVVIAMACCSSLGFGLALGFGTLLGLGRAQPVAPVQTAAVPVEQAIPIAVGQETSARVVAPEAETFVPTVDVTVALQSSVPAAETASLVPWLPLQPVRTAQGVDVIDVPRAQPDLLPGSEPTLADKLGAIGADVSKLDLRVYAPDAMPGDKLETDLARLEGTGLSIENLQRVGFAVSTAHIRFYNAEDATIATALAADLQIEARDFTNRQSGPLGLVEVWFDGTSKGRPANANRNGRNGDYLLDRLRDRLFGN